MSNGLLNSYTFEAKKIVYYSVTVGANNKTEAKRIDILLNKTREEIAKDYVTREQMEQTFQRIIDSIERIDEKIDRLQTKTYFQD